MDRESSRPSNRFDGCLPSASFFRRDHQGPARSISWQNCHTSMPNRSWDIWSSIIDATRQQESDRHNYQWGTHLIQSDTHSHTHPHTHTVHIMRRHKNHTQSSSFEPAEMSGCHSILWHVYLSHLHRYIVHWWRSIRSAQKCTLMSIQPHTDMSQLFQPTDHCVILNYLEPGQKSKVSCSYFIERPIGKAIEIN